MDTSRAFDLHRTHDHEDAARSSSDGGNDMKEIVAQFPRDRGHDRLNFMAHGHRAIVAIKSTSPPNQTARDFWAKSSFKTDVLSCFLLTLD